MEIVNEVWKDIKGYPNYQISNYGRVWHKKKQRYVAQSHNNKGYCQVWMYAINGKRKHELVHRLVALAFITNSEGKPEVNHINHIRDDNRVENLEWVTHGENNTIGRKQNYKHKQEWYEKRYSNIA